MDRLGSNASADISDHEPEVGRCPAGLMANEVDAGEVRARELASWQGNPSLSWDLPDAAREGELRIRYVRWAPIVLLAIFEIFAAAFFGMTLRNPSNFRYLIAGSVSLTGIVAFFVIGWIAPDAFRRRHRVAVRLALDEQGFSVRYRDGSSFVVRWAGPEASFRLFRVTYPGKSPKVWLSVGADPDSIRIPVDVDQRLRTEAGEHGLSQSNREGRYRWPTRELHWTWYFESSSGSPNLPPP